MSRLLKVHKNSGTGIAVAIVDDEDYLRLQRYHWCLGLIRGRPYAVTQSDESCNIRLRMSQIVLGVKMGQGKRIHFINGNTLDCRKANLRLQ